MLKERGHKKLQGSFAEGGDLGFSHIEGGGTKGFHPFKGRTRKVLLSDGEGGFKRSRTQYLPIL